MISRNMFVYFYPQNWYVHVWPKKNHKEGHFYLWSCSLNNNSEVTNQNGQQGKRKNRFLCRCLTNLKSSLQKARKIFSVLFIIMERQSKSMTLILNRLFATMHNLQSSESAPNFAFRLFWVSYSSGMVLWVRTNLWVRNNLSELSLKNLSFQGSQNDWKRKAIA